MRNQPTEDVKSLVGKIDVQAMGQNASRSKPVKKDKKVKKKTAEREFKGGDFFTQNFDESIYYRPKTKENKIIYENYLGRVYELVQDQPPQQLHSIADEVLAIIRGDEPDAKKKIDVETIVGAKIKQDTFIDLCNVAKSLSDYSVEAQEGFNDIIAINEDEESENQESQDEIIEQEEVEVEENEQVQIKKQSKKEEMEVEAKEEEGLDITSIDAHWIEAQLLNYYEATEAQRMAKEILSVLNGKAVLEVENSLLSILNYDRFDLVSLFLKNRKAIYYCVKYHQTQNEKEKQHLLQEMKQEGIVFAKKKNKQVESVQKSRRQIEDEDHQQPVFRAARDDQIVRINKKIIDLNIHDIEDRTANKQEYKFRLPEGAEKIERVGYEEVHIPASLKTVNQTLVQVQSLPLWMQPVFAGYKRFNPIQSRVLPYALKSDGNMLVCAPTSAGKTFVALLTILKAISEYRDEDSGSIDYSKFKVVYIAPMKALVSQITGNLSNRLKTLGITVKELTGDVHLSKSQIEETQVIISTPEKWDIITRKTGERMFVEQVKLIIIDEIHLLSDSRGPVLESIIARSIRKTEAMQQNTRIVGLSATLPNYRDVGACLRVKKEGLFYFDQSYRPIPLQQRYIGVTQKKGVRKMLMINEILYEKVMERVGNFQMIIFVHSRRDTVRTANYIKDTAFAKNQLNRLMRPQSESKKILESIIEKEGLNSKDLKELLPSGIAVHHAGLSREDRTMVEQLFGDRHINVLVSTATLAWGVNLPAHTVIIKGTQVYSPEEGRWVQLSLQDVMQMLGRAGRPRFDTQGQGIILTGYEQVRYYLNLLNMQIPLESQMLRSLADQLNAEVVQGSVTNLRDAVNWLSYTYLYIRMLRNPKHYGIAGDEIEEDKQLLKRRVNLAHSAFSILQRNGLINYDRKNGVVSANFLGKIASYYYIKYASMSIYNSNLKSSSNLIELLRIFAMSIEFKYLAVREEEKNELKKLIETVPVPIKGTVEEVTTKISALLQAHISKLNMEGFALNIDKVYVSQSASRIMRALFEITLKRGWGLAAQRTLELAKMIDRSMWSCLNPLRQFKQIPQYVLSRLEKKEQFSWESFYQMNPQQIGDLTRFPKLGKILHKFVHHVPRVQIQAYAQPLTRSCLKVDLTATCDFKWQDEYHGREQPFWLMVLDCNQQTILYSYYFTLSKQEQAFSTQFIVPLFEIMHPLYYIKVISDRWICADNVLPLSFKSMVLPSRFSQPQELLDLQPIPAHSLDPVAKQLKINYLNQIQTQAYPAFANSHGNVFLGASEGSGKFSLAVLAMSQTLQQQKKVVLIVSHKVIAQKKTALLTKIFHSMKKKVGRTFEDLNKDSQILAASDVIVTTPEAWDVLTRRWKSRKGFSQVGLIVIDNLHLLGEGNSTLEVVISRMRYISSQLGQAQGQNGQSIQQFRLICLSASLADYKEVAQWIGSPPENTFNFHPSVRPNSVEVVFNSFDQPFRQTRLHMMQKQLMQSILHYNRNCLVVVNDKKQARITALDLVSELSSEANPKRLKHITDKLLQTISKRISDQYLLHLIEYGIAYIYEGMPEMERQMVDQLFKAEGISVLVVTQSLKWELDFKVFMVAVLDTTYFDPKTRRWVDYSIPEMAQLMSLPAVFQRDRQKGKQFSNAKFVIFCQSAKKAFYKKFLFQPYPLQSALHHNLHNHFNSAVVAKSISNKGEGVDWLTWTFMYRRLLNNPNYYNMDEANEQSISLYLSDLIDQTTEYLVHIKCLQCDEEEDALAATNLGIICSYYYINVQTLATYVQKVTQNMKLKDIIEIVSQAQELVDFQYRPKEYQIIAQYLTQVGEKPLNKPHGLILLHLYRIHMTAQLNHQLRTMLPLCVRLTHALVDVISSLGYLKPLIFCMQFCQMLVQAMWINQSPLLQILDKGTVKILNQQYEVKDIAQFVDMDQKAREKALKGKDIQKIAEACNRYPTLNLEYTLGQVEDDQMQMKVQLSRDEPLERDFVMSNYYPEDKQEFWWVIIGDKKSNKVLTTKRTLVHHKVELNLDFEVGDCSKVAVYALCDSYIGCDQAEEVELSV